MSLKLSKFSALAVCLVVSLNAMAEGQADRLNEHRKLKISHSEQHMSPHQSAVTHMVGMSESSSDIPAHKLKYTGGFALKEYPQKTAHQRKYLVFGSNN